MLALVPDLDLNAHAKQALLSAYTYGKSECVKFLLGKREKEREGSRIDENEKNRY